MGLCLFMPRKSQSCIRFNGQDWVNHWYQPSACLKVPKYQLTLGGLQIDSTTKLLLCKCECECFVCVSWS